MRVILLTATDEGHKGTRSAEYLWKKTRKKANHKGHEGTQRENLAKLRAAESPYHPKIDDTKEYQGKTVSQLSCWEILSSSYRPKMKGTKEHKRESPTMQDTQEQKKPS